MSKISKSLLAAIAVGSIATGSADAISITNPGFETGNFTGWTVNPASLASVVTSVSHNLTYTAPDGTYFADLSAGAGANVYTMVSQLFTASAGDTLGGSAAFLANDYLPYNDNAFLHVLDANNNLVATLWTSSVSVVGNYGQTPWQAWSWTASTSGSYRLEFGVENLLDNGLSSAALLDVNTPASASVPDASSTAMLMIGALGTCGLFRRAMFGQASKVG